MRTERVNGALPPGGTGPRPARQEKPGQSVFADALNQAEGPLPLRVSSHARTRLEQRQVALGAAEAARLAEGVQRAEEKGVKQPLIMLDDMAFVISMANRTIITAVDAKRNGTGIFTNIDSVVVV